MPLHFNSNMTTKTTTSTWAYSLNEWGGPLLPPPPTAPTLVKRAAIFLIMYVVFFFAWPVILAISTVRGKGPSRSTLRHLFRVVNDAHKHPISKDTRYQDPELLAQVYRLPSAQPYLECGALEWQPREGFCAGTTVRCLIKSFSSIPATLVPPVTSGAKTAQDVCKTLEGVGQQPGDEGSKIHLESRLLQPDQNVSYATFLQELETNLQNPDTRVAVNYLRPALFGWSLPWYLWPVAPISLLLGLFGGHFSFILGILPSVNGDPLVAIFDVNHKYGGTYLVPARRFYDSVKAEDVTTNLSRALVFVTDKSKHK
jgi:hypothetical protein